MKYMGKRGSLMVTWTVLMAVACNSGGGDDPDQRTTSPDTVDAVGGNDMFGDDQQDEVQPDCPAGTYRNFGDCVESAFSLPEDAAPHQNIMEWWYYTGHVSDGDRHFGFEISLFQQRMEDLLGITAPPGEEFGFMCHVAFLDKTTGDHAYTQAISTTTQIWDWYPVELKTMNCHIQMDGHGNDRIIGTIPEGQEGSGRSGSWMFDLTTKSLKPVVHHGGDGIIPMSIAGTSYYYSFTRLDAEGTVRTPDGEFEVTGQAWMDHQWGDFETMAFKGWDWWSMQFEDGWEIMLFQFRDWSDVLVEQAGTIIDPDGNIRTVDGLDAFHIVSHRTWASSQTDGVYPLDWDIVIDELNWVLEVRTDFDAQEVPNFAKNYWEGAVRIAGTRDGTPVEGVGFVELTGYASNLMDPK